jgi:hypothetical protein
VAAGCTIDESQFEAFEFALQQVARSGWMLLASRLDTDGPLPAS